jgi:hypothetical protein
VIGHDGKSCPKPGPRVPSHSALLPPAFCHVGLHFIIPDEIVPVAVSLKGSHDLIDAARKKRAGAARGKLLGLAVEMGMTVLGRNCRQTTKTISLQGKSFARCPLRCARRVHLCAQQCDDAQGGGDGQRAARHGASSAQYP